MGGEVEKLLVNATEVAGLLGVGLSTVRKWSCGAKPAPPGFPRPVKLGLGLSGKCKTSKIGLRALGSLNSPLRQHGAGRGGPGRLELEGDAQRGIRGGNGLDWKRKLTK
jgi:predicted DNA-binding transcriptional regulator AlpA